MKDYIDYFTHDTVAGEHPKCQALIAVYGFEGYGRFWRLNELIGRSHNCQLDLSRKIYRNQIAGKLKMTPEELHDFIQFLADPEECGLFQLVDNLLITQRTQDDLGYVLNERQAARRRKKGGSAEPDQSSAELDESSGELNHDRQTDGRKDRQTDSAVDLQSWLQDYAATHPSIRNPGGFVRSVLTRPSDPKYDDVMAEYRKYLATPRAFPPEPSNEPPPPERCDICGSDHIFAGGQSGEAVCRNCGRFFLLRDGEWIPDPETGQAVDDFPEDDYQEEQA